MGDRVRRSQSQRRSVIIVERHGQNGFARAAGRANGTKRAARGESARADVLTPQPLYRTSHPSTYH